MNGLFAWEMLHVWYSGWRNSVLINFPGRWGIERVMRLNKGGPNTQKPLVPLPLWSAVTTSKSFWAETIQLLQCFSTCSIFESQTPALLCELDLAFFFWHPSGIFNRIFLSFIFLQSWKVLFCGGLKCNLNRHLLLFWIVSSMLWLLLC